MRKVLNGENVYYSTSVDEAETNIAYLFGICPVRTSEVLPCSKIAKTASSIKKRCLDALLAEGLSQLCTKRLSSSAACEWLGKWLLENNEKAPGCTTRNMDASISLNTYEKSDEIAIPPLTDMHVVAVSGSQGSGKTTQSKLLEAEKGYFYIDASEVMQSVLAKNGDQVSDLYLVIIVVLWF